MAYYKITLCKKGGKAMRSFMAKKEEVKRDWYVIDAAGKPLGRLASKVAMILKGKHKPTYTPHVDTGDYVIIVNADKEYLRERKWTTKSTTITAVIQAESRLKASRAS